MIGVGVHPNDILVVDRSIEPVPGKIVICALNGELTVKRLDRFNGHWQLKAENPNYADLYCRFPESVSGSLFGQLSTCHQDR